MSIVSEYTLNFNRNIKINFDGGNHSSDSGLFIFKEFMEKIGFDTVLDEFKTNDTATFRIHKDASILKQVIYQIIAGYFPDDCADKLRNDPVFCAVLNKGVLASQPSESRFFNRTDESTLDQLSSILKAMRKIVYSIEMPEYVVLDIDTTLCDTYGHQEGASFNYHYQANGYHPIVCFDSMTGDFIAEELREGTQYCCKGIREFIEPVLKEYTIEYPEIAPFVRGDSGFATDELYTICEEYGVKYSIRLKENPVLKRLAEPIVDRLLADIKESKNNVDYAVAYGEFSYQAKSWDSPRRVVCKVEKFEGQIAPTYTFVVTNMEHSNSRVLIDFYCKRGNMENMIKECKSGFDMTSVSSSKMIVNANRVMMHALAYNIFNWMRRLVLPEKMKKDRIETFRLRLMKIAARIVRSARYVYFKLCSTCVYMNEFMEVLNNIQKLNPQLE